MALAVLLLPLLVAIGITTWYICWRDARRTPDPMELDDLLRLADWEYADRDHW